ncbi:MAG TPA: KH domain-containing protein [Acidobacteriaceae bacterium]
MADPRDVSVYHVLFKIVSSLVDHSGEVIIQTVMTSEGATFTVSVHKDDVAQLVGDGGRIAEAIRIILRGFGARMQRRFTLIIEDEPDIQAYPAFPLD